MINNAMINNSVTDKRVDTEQRDRRGMVTAELAVGLLAVALLISMAAGLAGTLQLQARCVDAASEIARQAARGDDAAVDRAMADVPDGAVVERHREDDVVVVTVRVPVRLANLPAFQLSATARTIVEPGLGP